MDQAQMVARVKALKDQVDSLYAELTKSETLVTLGMDAIPHNQFIGVVRDLRDTLGISLQAAMDCRRVGLVHNVPAKKAYQLKTALESRGCMINIVG